MSTLQALLNLGLVDIGSDDSRFAKIEATAVAVVKFLLSNPTLVIPATLVAMDRDVDEDDPIFALVDEQLVKKWKTIRNTHVNKPRELLRSIVIHALSVLGTGHPRMAAAIWHTAVSHINHGQARLGNEADLVSKMLQNFQKRAEDDVIAGTLPSEPRPTKRQHTAPSHAPAPLKDEDLIADIGRAAGPHDSAGKAFDTPNPNWSNSAPQWSYDFAPRMTGALVKAVNLGMERVLSRIDRVLESHRSELEQRLTNNFETSAVRVSNRLDVLWWSEAKYSSSLRLGYREMQGAVAAVSMAHDLSVLVPAMAPTSMTYVLGEAVAALSQRGSKSEPCSVESLLGVLQAGGSSLRGILPNTKITKGRVPFFELVANTIGGNPVEAGDVSPTTGIDLGLEISLPEFSMWMFRDIQARKLVEEFK